MLAKNRPSTVFWDPQLVPPLVVTRMVPPKPFVIGPVATAKHVVVLGQLMPKRLSGVLEA
jgi:hypothetical protein